MTIKLNKLSNGFQVITEKIPGIKTVSVGVWIKVGGRHETNNQTGLAHFLEHMAFKGTEKRTAVDIVNQIENVGGYMNAYTSREVTNYYMRVLPENTELAIEILHDILLNSIFDEKEIDLERNVILQEIGQYLDTPDEIIFDWLQEISYPNQSVGRSILGYEKLVKSYCRDDLLNFTKKHYIPNKMILCAAGDVSHQKILDLSEKLFGNMKNSIPDFANKCDFVGGSLFKKKNLEQTHLAMSFETSGLKSEDIYANQIFSIILGGGMSSRLFQEVREKRGLCYSIYSSIDALSDSGTLTIYAGTNKEKISELSSIIIKEIKKVSNKIDQKELERSKAQIKAGILMGMESTPSRCERLSRSLITWNKIKTLDEIIKKIDKVNLDDLRKVGENMCLSDNFSLVVYGQIGKDLDFNCLKNSLKE